MSARVEWILEDFSVHAPAVRYEAGWTATDADLAEESGWDSLAAALAWGRPRAPIEITAAEGGLRLDDALELARSRSDVVVVGILRLPGTYDYFNAGSQPA